MNERPRWVGDLITGFAVAALFGAVYLLPPDTSLAEVKQAGVLRVCVPTRYPPLVTGKPEEPGFDIEFAQAVARGLDAAAQFLGESRRDLARQRQEVIAANPELRERELAKLADYAATVAGALRERGLSEAQAIFASEAGMTVLRVALERWAYADDDRDLTDIMRESVAEWRAVTVTG